MGNYHHSNWKPSRSASGRNIRCQVMQSGRLCGTRRVFSALFGLSWLTHSLRIVSLLPSSDRKPVWLVPVHSSFHAMSTSLIIFRPCELLGSILTWARIVIPFGNPYGPPSGAHIAY